MPDQRPPGTLARQSLVMLDHLAPDAPLYVWAADANGVMDAESRGFLRYLGTEADVLAHKGWADHVHPDDRNRVGEIWKRSIPIAEPFHLEYRIRHHTGEFRWFLLAASPVFDDDGRLDSWIGTAIERHEQHTAQLELERTAAILRSASRLGRLGAWSFDLQSRELLWSDEVCALHEVEPGFVPVVDTSIEFYLPEDRPIIEAAVMACIERAESYDLELRFVTARGNIRWCRTIGEAEFDAAGRVVRVSGAFRDITERKLAELAIRASEERFRRLSTVTSDVVADWDLVNGEAWYGDGLAELLGVDPAEVAPGRIPTDPLGALWPYIHPDDGDRIRVELAEILLGAQQEWQLSFRLVRPSGHVAELTVSGSSVIGEGGRVERLLAGVVDDTVARDLERRLARSQHLESIGHLTGGIAHDFNNLLAVVIGGLDLIEDSLIPGSSDAGALERVRAAAERGADLTSQLLAFARQQALEPRPVAVPELIESAAALVRSLIDDRVELSIDLGDEALPPALVDPGQLETAIVNLCVNGRDAMPDGGALVIRVRRATLDRPSRRPAVSIEVTDHGAGMADDVLARVLEPFYTTKPMGRGTGLGLSIVYGFVEQSGGSMSIDSSPGCGTTVRLVVPVAVHPALDNSVADLGAAVAHHAATELSAELPLTVLVVEDDPLVRSVAVGQLTSMGHRVLEAADGPAALEMLREPPGQASIDLLFTDVIMPGGIDGRELASAALALRPDLALLFTTGYAGETPLVQLPDGYPMQVIYKPYRLADLRTRVAEIAATRER